MRRLVVLIVGALLSAALVPAAVAAQSASPLTEVALLELDGCFEPAQFVVSSGFIATGGCFQGPGMQIATEREGDDGPEWRFEPVEGLPQGHHIGATRTTFAGVLRTGGDFRFVSANSRLVAATAPFPDSVEIYNAGVMAGGRAPNGAERFVSPVPFVNGDFGNPLPNFVVLTRQPTGPMGEVGWSSDVLEAPTDGSVPLAQEFSLDLAPAALIGDLVALAYEAFDGVGVVLANVETGEYRSVPDALPAGDDFVTPIVVAGDAEADRAFIGWGGLDLGAPFPAVTMIDLATAMSTEVTGLPEDVTALTVVRRDDDESDLLVATGAGELYHVVVNDQGEAFAELLMDTEAGADDLTVTALSGSADLLAVMERTTSFTVAPRAQVRVFELGDLGGGPSSAFNVEAIAPGTDPGTYEVGPFAEIKDLIVGEPGLPVTECLVDVESANEMAICFVAGARQAYIDALIATERPPDEVLWIGRSSEEPVKP